MWNPLFDVHASPSGLQSRPVRGDPKASAPSLRNTKFSSLVAIGDPTTPMAESSSQSRTARMPLTAASMASGQVACTSSPSTRFSGAVSRSASCQPW